MTASPNIAAQRPTVDFWKFWAGQTISNLGSSFTDFALPLLIFKLTGSALNLAIAKRIAAAAEAEAVIVEGVDQPAHGLDAAAALSSSRQHAASNFTSAGLRSISNRTISSCPNCLATSCADTCQPSVHW